MRFRGNIDTVMKLVDLGAPINDQDGDKLTPLAYAVINDHEEITLALVEKGADYTIKDCSGESILDMATPDLQEKMKVSNKKNK